MLEDFARQLIILGNGFDLQCGLKSNYKDFFEYILENKYKRRLESTWNPNLNIIENFENYLEEIFNAFSTRNLFGDYDISEPFIPEMNTWYLIFLFEKINSNANWSDIEEMIKKYVFREDREYTFADILVNAVFTKLFYRKIDLKYVLEHENLEKFSYLIIYQLFYSKRESRSLEEFYSRSTVISKKAKAQALFYEESKLNNLFQNYIEEYYDKFKRIMINFLFSELRDLEFDFQQYILSQELNKKSEYGTNARKLFRTMAKDIESSKFNIYSFNYTQPWFDIDTPLQGLSKHFNVHGNLSGLENGECYTIFGIDKGNIDPNSLEYRFTKEYRTFELYMTTDFTSEENEEIFPSPQLIEAIKFYGHSLAEADYSYFQHLFDYYNLYNNNKLKLIFYYSEYEGGNPEKIRQEQLVSILRLLDKYGETLDNKFHGKNLSTHLIQTGRLKLVKI
ncbi:AbiH family protein [Streptococcus orisasini]